MLGLLATTLLKKKLPLVQKDLEAMTEGAARAASPAQGPCDYDLALLKTLERAVWLSPARTRRAEASRWKRTAVMSRAPFAIPKSLALALETASRPNSTRSIRVDRVPLVHPASAAHRCKTS